MKTPLLVHLVFHPDSDDARAVALAIQASLFGDPVVPGLAIPSVITPEDGTGSPPFTVTLDEAEHTAVILLADDFLILERDEVPDRIDWREYAARLANACTGNHRFIPIQLAESAWGFHQDLEGIAFAKAWSVPPADRTEWVVRRVVIELVRFALRLSRGDKAPITLFLSHAKGDITTEPRAFEELVAHLQATGPVKTWIDSADIESGSAFAQEIENGIQDAAVVAIVTRTYSSRPWCRREVLLAKEKQRPLIVVDALATLDQRWFPYLGNVPVLRWTPGCAANAVDLLLIETLRHAHARMVLARSEEPGDLLFASPPELATLAALAPDARVLYPDPPVDDAEQQLIDRTGRKASTPLSRLSARRPCRGRKIAIAVSESGDCERYGMFPSAHDAVLLELTRHLLVAGATLAYGGHLGSKGYTEALFNLREGHRAVAPGQPLERVLNYLGWPLPFGTMEMKTRTRLEKSLKFRRVARPAGVEDLDPAVFVAEPYFFPPDSPARRFAWARGMTEMRRVQTEETGARIVIGGSWGRRSPRNPMDRRRRRGTRAAFPACSRRRCSPFGRPTTTGCT